MNTIFQEGRYSELGTKHKDLLTAMETEGLQEKLKQFDTVMESQCPCIQVFTRLHEVYPNVHTRIKRGSLESPP